MRQKTVADRAAELTSSMVAAAFWSVVLTVPMTMIGGSELTQSPHWLAGPAWLALLTTLGAWLVLAAGKCCEGSQGEALKRRLAMLVLGLIVGAVGYAAHDYLLVAFEPGRELKSAASRGGSAVFTGGPALTVYLAYFAAAFATVGWWKQVDPLRSSRLRIGSVLVALFAGWLWQLVWHFPQPWGFFVIAGTSIAAQLSAPWISHAERSAALARCQGG